MFKRFCEVIAFLNVLVNTITISIVAWNTITYPQNLETAQYLKILRANNIRHLGNLKFAENFEENLDRININLKKELKKKIMKIVKYNNNQIFPSLINEFFNDDFGINFLNRNYSVPSVNTIENDDSFEIDLAVPGMKKDDFSIELDNNVLVISSEASNNVSNELSLIHI